MKIALIGSGNVATLLGLELGKYHQVTQVYSYNLANAQQLAWRLSAQAIDELAQLTPADVYILAVKDSVIEELAQQIVRYVGDRLVIHTSGSVDVKVLSHLPNYGVFYPLQTFSKAKPVDWLKVPLLLEANNDASLRLMRQFAVQISGRIYNYNSEQRRALHLAAVIACNFSNFLYGEAYDYLAEKQVDFDLLKSLILETAQKAVQFVPTDVQTGPAIRGDVMVLKRHSEMLADKPDLQRIYQVLSEGILQRHKSLAKNDEQ